jgi:hypothetical protein
MMAWRQAIREAREAHLRAVLAEHASDWHLAVKDYLFCLEAAEAAGDVRATRFFAAKLVAAYSAMGFAEKAARYRELEALAQG